MEFKQLLEQLTELALPQDEYILVGSAPLAIRDIRQAQDIDLLAMDNLWNKLAKKYPMIKEYSIDKIILAKDIEVCGEGSMFHVPEVASLEEMIKSADTFKGHRFLNLELLKKFKAKMGREKDLKDVQLIDQYLATHPKD